MTEDPIFSEPLQQVDRVFVRYRGRKYIYFGGCDYHRLSSDRRVLNAIQRGIERSGLNVAASRKTTGNHLIYEQLERELAKYFRSESALITPNGYATNLAVAQGLAGELDCAYIDERAHPSLQDAVRFLECPVVVFKHRSEEDLKAKLAKGKVAVLTDGMFALDGTVPQLGKYAKLIGKNSYLWIDDSHAAGVLGNNGGGTVDLFDLGGANVIQTTTLSKGFGVYGGVILGSGKLREKIARRSRVMIGSTPFPLPLAKGVMVSCRLLAKGRMGKKLERNVKLLERQLGWEREFPTPIFGVQNKEPGELKSALIARDVFPSFIRYPGGPEEGYFRFAVSSLHNQEQLIRLAEALKAAGQGEA